VAADQGPLGQPNKASSTDERLPDLRAIVAATTLQSLARESLLASLARRQASPPKSEMCPQPVPAFEHNAPRSAVTGITARAAKRVAGPPKAADFPLGNDRRHRVGCLASGVFT